MLRLILLDRLTLCFPRQHQGLTWEAAAMREIVLCERLHYGVSIMSPNELSLAGCACGKATWDKVHCIMELGRYKSDFFRLDSGELSLNATLHVTQPTQRDDKWQENPYGSCQVFVRAYSRCEVSKKVDKVAANNGIQQLSSTVIRDMVTDGLWSSGLIQNLCWIHDLTQSWRASWELGI
ncbi:uncharacterized protein BDR25DRAFT_349290 [Lindgomyces ingoldianus]|uniref:Uncharacterized protein n=1 Tax=Lindgomyces ingoldianus TaxID=673940 RepID=A0ACB6RBS3_9PLEO|nr:uncharacterized protein BDR25DRAFT_349290 [Lindgomyces ingoldianus]KAF2476170.1 hypothetical protein BDR25DRAFT_349290 [Lindgomyces ingoldianus]